MADSKLRLAIVTELDNAGIKATKELIDGLEKAVKSAGNSGQESMGKLSGSVTGIPGKFGKVCESLGSLGKAMGAVTASIAVFKEGFDIGLKVREWLGNMFEWAKTNLQIMEELIREEESYQQMKRDELDLCKIVAQRKLEIWQKETETMDKSVEHIDNQTRSYLRQVSALKGIKDARDDAEMLAMERAKFEDVEFVRQQYGNEQAEQLAKAYDISIQQLKLKKEIQNFDLETLKLQKSKTAEEEKYLKKMEALEKAEASLAREEEKLKQVLPGAGDKYAVLEKVIEKARLRYERAFQQAKDLADKLYEGEADTEKRLIMRSNILSRGSLNLDRMALDYDTYTQGAGNPLNILIDPEWSLELLDLYKDLDTIQKGILENTAGLAEKLDQLLQLK